MRPRRPWGTPCEARAGPDKLASRSLASRETPKLRHENRFAPAAPQRGHGVHHYHFQVFALDAATNLEPGIERSALVDLLKGHVVAWGEIVGTYERR